MGKKKKTLKNLDTLDAGNARTLAELVVDPDTTEASRIQILNKLLEGRQNPDFFPTIYEEHLSLGSCPHCDHKSHWLIPEDVLNKFGYVTHKEDNRVPVAASSISCKEFQESCLKKKISI